MAPGVISDKVAGGNDAADERWLRSCVVTDHEECGANAVGGEDIEKPGSPGGVGAIVESKGELAGVARRDEGSAKDARGGPESGVSTTAGSKGKAGNST